MAYATQVRRSAAPRPALRLIVTPRPSYQDAIRSIALQALEGDNTDARIASLSRVYRRDPASVTAEVDEMIDTLR